MALAEKVLEALRTTPDDSEPTATVTTKRHTSSGPKGHSRKNTLGHSSGGMFTKSGKPAPNPMSRGADQSAEAKAGRTNAWSKEKIDRTGSSTVNPEKVAANVAKAKKRGKKSYADEEHKDISSGGTEDFN